MKSTINILGSTWKIQEMKSLDLDNADGYTDTSVRTIKIEKFENSPGSKKDLEVYRKQVLRHEIIHAFLYESGLESNSNRSEAWAQNEEMVDWFSIQSPKIFAVFKELDLI